MRGNWNIGIESVDNGIVVSVGCKRMVFKRAEIETFCNDLQVYLTNPNYETERALQVKYFPEDLNDAPQGCIAEAPTLVRTVAAGQINERR